MNSTPKQLLVAVDGSPAAIAAVDVAVEVAAAMGARVLFVHAVTKLAEELYSAFSDEEPSPDEVIARDPVLAEACRKSREAGVEAEVEVIPEEGGSADLAASVSGMAAGRDATMVVTGSRGRGAMAGAILGSFSHNLIRYATVPVLVVHDPAHDEQARV
jgi:nucleotide-binding universal stress UspA family protein